MKVNGIILVLSCQKHKNTRLPQFKLPQDNYGDWKVIYVIGDLFLDREYSLHENVMTIRCEDSYIHLLKKLVLALKYVYELYDIQEGVLRCGDDLIFNEQLLQNFSFNTYTDILRKSNIEEYLYGTHYNHKTKSERKLLLNKKELKKLFKDSDNKGLTIVPLRLFTNEKGLAKLDIALCRGKKNYDKRESLKEQDTKRDIDRIKKSF